MKTTVDIPNDVLRDLMAFTKAETKKEAIVRAVTEFNSRQRMSRLTRFAGTFHEFMNQRDLKSMREGKP